MSLQLEIILPNKIAFQGQVEMFSVPSTEGRLGIYPHHEPTFLEISEGKIKIKKDKKELFFFVGEGYLEIAPEKSILYTQKFNTSEEEEKDRLLKEVARGKVDFEEEQSPALKSLFYGSLSELGLSHYQRFIKTEMGLGEDLEKEEGGLFLNWTAKYIYYQYLKKILGGRVLDLGAGFRGFYKKMIKDCRHIYSLDFTEKTVDYLQEKHKDQKISFGVFNPKDKLIKKVDKCDYVLANFSFHQIEDLSLLAKKLNKILKKEGRVVASLLHPLLFFLIQSSDENLPGETNIFKSYFETIRGIDLHFSDASFGFLYRPLREVITPFLNHEFILRGFEELQFPKKFIEKNLNYQKYQSLPIALILDFEKRKEIRRSYK